MIKDNKKNYLFDWRSQFNESELTEIDAAAPGSIIGRLAATLDRLTVSRADRSSLTIDFRRKTHE